MLTLMPHTRSVLILTLGLGLLSVLGSLALSSYLVYLAVSSEHSVAQCPVVNISAAVCTNVSTATVRETTVEVERVAMYTSPKKTCPGSRFHPLIVMNSPRYGDTTIKTGVHLIREPFVSCSPYECRHFALGHTAQQGGPYGGSSGGDRSRFRSLISTKLGEPFTIQNAIVHLQGWSGSACHDGKEWMYATVFGPDADASLRIRYGNLITDSFRSYAGNILRTQESECICTNGTCALMITDGGAGAGGISHARFLFIREGKIVANVLTTGRTKMTEECTCMLTSETEGMCACRDNVYTDRRPIVKIDFVSMTADVCLMCSQTRMDTPRASDSIPSSCQTDDGSGGGGIKGGFVVIRDTNNRYYFTRTTSTSSRVGMEVRGPISGDLCVTTGVVPLDATIVSSSVNTGYHSSFEMKGKDCDVPCFVVEHIRNSATWTTASSSVYCWMSSQGSPWDIDDGVDPSL